MHTCTGIGEQATKNEKKDKKKCSSAIFHGRRAQNPETSGSVLQYSLINRRIKQRVGGRFWRIIACDAEKGLTLRPIIEK